MNIAKFVENLTVSGRYHFTTHEAAKALDISIVAARTAIPTPPQERSYRDTPSGVPCCGTA